MYNTDGGCIEKERTKVRRKSIKEDIGMYMEVHCDDALSIRKGISAIVVATDNIIKSGDKLTVNQPSKIRIAKVHKVIEFKTDFKHNVYGLHVSWLRDVLEEELATKNK